MEGKDYSNLCILIYIYIYIPLLLHISMLHMVCTDEDLDR